jgi:hypothetical protein
MITLAVAWIGVALAQADGASERGQQIADLAKQIAAIAGPGPAKLTVRNLSSLNAEELPGIRKMLERDLRGDGVRVSDTDSATSIRVTLSENTAGGLWVAEVQEGTEVHVAMISVPPGLATQTQTRSGISLRKSLTWQQKEPVLDTITVQLADSPRMLVLEPRRIVSYAMVAGTWTKEQEFAISHSRPFPQDMRGRLLEGQGHLFDAYLPGVLCAGAQSEKLLTISCSDNDDPWPLSEASRTQNAVPQKAFYNATRDYFTGVLTPGFGPQLQPFYDSTVLPRPNGVAMLFNGIDGRVVMIENNMMKSVAGTRDWGSDLVSIRSGCGSGTQVLVSASGASPMDSIRAYEIPGREAEPVSPPLAFEGRVMALWPSEDGSVATLVMHVGIGGQAQRYEVYRVSALCS